MSKQGFVQVKAGTTGAASVYGGEQPGIADPNGRPGWYFMKDASSAVDAKLNWYVGAASNEVLRFHSLSCLWSIVTIDDFTATNSLPWLQIYTKPKADGLDASWYRSKLDLQIATGKHLVRPGERVCLWWGKHAPPADKLDGARMIHLAHTRTGVTIKPQDEIYLMNLATDSGASSVGLCAETIAYQVDSNVPQSRMINLHLIA